MQGLQKCSPTFLERALQAGGQAVKADDQAAMYEVFNKIHSNGLQSYVQYRKTIERVKLGEVLTGKAEDNTEPSSVEIRKRCRDLTARMYTVEINKHEGKVQTTNS